MVTDARHPLALAAVGAFQRALSYGAPANVRWEPNNERWRIESQSEAGSFRHVRRRKPLVEKPFNPDRKPNPAGWFFALSCDCPAGNPRDGSTPKVVCWHKAAVVFWCSVYRVLDPVVQRERYDAALTKHEGMLKAWVERVERGEIDVSRYLTTGNDPLPLGGGEWVVDAEDLVLVFSRGSEPQPPPANRTPEGNQERLPW